MERGIGRWPAVAAALLLCGCAMKNQRVRYDMKDIEPSTYTSLKDKVLLVREFSDFRYGVTDNEPLFSDDNSTKIDGRMACLNSERHYKFPVPQELRDTIAAHLRQRGAFKDVVVDENAPHDFALSGSLERLYGRQDVSMRAAVGSQFGLIGALMSLGARSDGEVHIWMSHLKLTDRDGNLIKEIGALSHDLEGSYLADGYCWQIYNNVNDQLKAAVDLLAGKIEDAGVQYALFKK